jgi:hypothetical protein
MWLYQLHIDIELYFKKEKQHKAQDLTTTHTTATELSRKVEGWGHKLYMDNFFSSPALFDDLTKKN